ncbi:MAG TPA: Ni/Fe hydrogenase subunit alpha [Terriglobales bacterium]|nr:Ni/Fe hydrogenase subunit alpha [Terriglobales bacterium]
MKRVTIEPVSRIEGHAKITIQLNDSGQVENAELHVTQVRGFEKLTEGRPYYEMPGITARICGICPISHLLASSKACDAILAVKIPPAARKLRELIHCAQFVQSHALSFFYLSSPDLILGMDAYPATRNVLGIIASHPELARDGIELRKFGLQVIESLGQERVHSPWIVPGGVKSPMTHSVREKILSEIPKVKQIADKTLQFFKSASDAYKDDIAKFGYFPTMYLGLVNFKGDLQLYEGNLRFRDADDGILADQIPADDYSQYIGEATLRNSYLKAPFYKLLGLEGVYRVGPLARLNVAERCGTLQADKELDDFRRRYGKPAHSSFLYHQARLIEIVYALERMEALLSDQHILDDHVRSTAGVNSLEGVGMIEAPRGVLIHHYKVNSEGAITWANLIVATGHNNLAMGKSVKQVAKEYVHGDKIQEGMLNRVSAVVRAYDPCLSCSTHADGSLDIGIRLLSPAGKVLDQIDS